eukprot:TRINITY_DN558_c0_g1_i1.p1 TRINITY_DN558_c0_g1~~TRINITY_DN558_c0_g1_i1.p1  ORF type:complete len:291 (+),score=63.99 TRINITY_DN558_c0_g1_i1:186-1058(+)
MADTMPEETPDEWTALADSYTTALVPSFAPIYNEIATLVQDRDLKILDFGCGPGEPALTLLDAVPSRAIIAVDSAKPMLEIAKKRADAKTNITFKHVRRDVKMEELKALGTDFDAVVSTLTIHYVDFPRRVQLTTTFLEIAPFVLFAAWGDQRKVGFLRAIKTFATWKGATETDICTVTIDNEDDQTAESPRGSFTMARKETFQAIADQAHNAKLDLFETKIITLKFPSVRALLSFLPMPIGDADVEAMWKLLQQWNQDDQGSVTLSDSPDAEVTFPCDVAFCRIARQDG